MKRNSDKPIIPKIIVILGTLSILGIFLLFFRPRPHASFKAKRPDSPQKLFTQVLKAAVPTVLRLWTEADRYFPKHGVNCPQEILHDEKIGKSYYQCNPHFWQCYWEGGVTPSPSLEVELFGQTFHVVASPTSDSRYYELFKQSGSGLEHQYGYTVELRVIELPGFSQSLILADSCRDTYLPERIYGYGQVSDRTKEGFIWDNFGRNIFIDKFYVTNRRVNEWRRLTGKDALVIHGPEAWPQPALLDRSEQKDYCAFYGKRLLEAKLFDAAAMTPSELKNSLPEMVYRPATPWQRDLSKTFLGMSRINPDYQLTPLDCQLAQVQGCEERLFTTDSATWMGFHYSLGFFPESVENFIEPTKKLKRSSRFLPASSPSHELGLYDEWDGKQKKGFPVAFRCYEEVIK